MAEWIEPELGSESARALSEIQSVIGAENLVLESGEVRRRSQDIIPRTHTAAAFAYPKSSGEIQKILAIANRYRIPVWPVSKGRNWGYGAASAVAAGSIILVLERMNRIIEVHPELAYAVVEPGVTFRQLHAHLVKNKIPLWLDCTDGPADGSVMGNSLERGIGETDYGDHFGNVCGLEVVLPDGSILQTGGGPKDSYRSWHTYKWGVGPYIEGLFSQSNFGVVTKMGVWLRPRPEYFSSCVFELTDERELPKLVDGLRWLELHGVLQSKVHLINEVATRAVAVDNFRDQEKTLKGYRLAPWTFAAGLYGSKAEIRTNIRTIRKILGPIGKLDFIDDRKLKVIQALTRGLKTLSESTSFGPLSNWFLKTVVGKPLSLLEILPHVHGIEKGYPSDYFVKHAYFKSRGPKPADADIDPVRDQCGLIWLGPMVPLLGVDVTAFLDLVRPLFVKQGFEMYVALMVGNPRTAIVLLSIFYDKQDPAETARAETLYFMIGELTQQRGYQQYRTSTLYMDRLFATAPEFAKLCRTLKGSIDPNNIMAPGKYGI